MAKDIRRDTGDINPTNYIRPGVVDTLAADLITGVTKGAIGIDAAVQTEKLADELDAARAGFITGSPATQEAYELGDDEADAEMNRQLAPLKSVLDGKKRAVEQGSITADRFQLEADVILQQAIARRPGLAPEFRQIHAQYTGGAFIEHLTKREQEMLQEHLQEGKAKASAEEKTMQAQAEILKEAGFAAEAGLVYGDSQAMQSLYQSKYEDISRFNKRKADAAFWGNTVDTKTAQTQMEIPARQQAWGSQFDLTLENIARSVRAAKPALGAADETQFAGMVNEFQIALTKEESRLEEQRVALGLKPEDVSARMALLKQYKEDAMKFLDGTVSLDQRKKNSETWALKLEAELRQDAPLIAAMAVVEKVGGPTTAAKLMEDSAVMSVQTKQEVTKFLLNQSGKAEAITPVASGLTASLLKDVFPQGTQTEEAPKPEAIMLLSRMGTAFTVMPNDKFRTRDYTDWIRELGFYSEALSEKVPDEQRMELARSVAMATYKNARVGMMQLMQDFPALKKQLVGNHDWNSSEPIAFRDGYKPTPEQEQAVDLANAQMGFGEAKKLIKSLGHLPDEQRAAQWVWEAAELVQGQEALAAVERKEQPTKPQAAIGMVGGSTPAGAPSAPPVGTVENGWRYTGGDPGLPSSWERAE